MNTVLVLGGTGAMGKHLVDELLARNIKVVVTSRAARRGRGGLDYRQGDAMDLGFIESLLANRWDAIVDFMNYPTSKFIESAPRLLRATSHYIFLSSARVYAGSDGLLTEKSARLLDSVNDADFLSTDEYSLAKARQEDYLRNCGELNWTIIRPYITYSENRLQLGPLEMEGWLYRALQGRAIVFPQEMLHRQTTMTYGLDVSRAISNIIGKPQSFGEMFHIASEDYISWGEVVNIYLEAIEKVLGVRPEMKLLSMDDFIQCRPAEYQIFYDRLYDRMFSSEKVGQFYDMKRAMSVHEGLELCLRGFLSSSEFGRIDWRLEAIKDRFTGEVAKISEFDSWKNAARYYVNRFVKRI